MVETSSIAELVGELMASQFYPETNVAAYQKLKQLCFGEYFGGSAGTWFVEQLKDEFGRKIGWRLHLANPECMFIQILTKDNSFTISEPQSRNYGDKKQAHQTLLVGLKFLFALLDRTWPPKTRTLQTQLGSFIVSNRSLHQSLLTS
jgi:hypothetical protein